MSIEPNKLKNIIEAAMFAVAHPMSVDQLLKLFDDDDRPSANTIKAVITQLQNDCEGRGIELKEIASGYRYQVRQNFSEWLSRLWEERPAKYSRAALETLALIAYRQPVTRAEIEDVRGVGVSSSIIKTMIEREWIRVVGHRDVPGRPALYATTKQFLDYFNMKSLEELPTLAEIKDLEDINPELNLPNPDDEREVSTDDSNKVSDEASEDQHGDNINQQNLLEANAENSVTTEEDSSQDEETADTEPDSSSLELESDEVLEQGSEQPVENDAGSEASDEYQGDTLKDHSESNQDRFYAEPENQSDPEY
jgi:segregation and condensation protein B